MKGVDRMFSIGILEIAILSHYHKLFFVIGKFTDMPCNRQIDGCKNCGLLVQCRSVFTTRSIGIWPRFNDPMMLAWAIQDILLETSGNCSLYCHSKWWGFDSTSAQKSVTNLVWETSCLEAPELNLSTATEFKEQSASHMIAWCYKRPMDPIGYRWFGDFGNENAETDHPGPKNQDVSPIFHQQIIEVSKVEPRNGCFRALGAQKIEDTDSSKK
jgi:hypothetical protein